MNGGEDFFKDKNDDFSSGAKRSSLKSLQQNRVPFIERTFMEVLGRKPSSRELSYYKYSALSEDEICIKLVSSDEHTKIIEDAFKLPGTLDQLRDSQLNEKRLTQKINDLDNQIAETNILLSEKNKIIDELREKSKNPYNLVEYSNRYEEGFDIYTAPNGVNKKIEKRSFKDLLKEFLDLIIK